MFICKKQGIQPKNDLHENLTGPRTCLQVSHHVGMIGCFITISVKLSPTILYVQLYHVGGYNGNKGGFAIPTGTDIFISVSIIHGLL